VNRLLRIFAFVTLLSLIHVPTARGDSLPDSAYISGVNGHAQGYSLSCESRSAADLADFWGVSISESEFLDALPRADNPEQALLAIPMLPGVASRQMVTACTLVLWRKRYGSLGWRQKRMIN
jgi:hypothetical protein